MAEPVIKIPNVYEGNCFAPLSGVRLRTATRLMNVATNTSKMRMMFVIGQFTGSIG